jgi:bifunctional DNA-binding transcriptional regulator/antitoxin component of YhaV-PrlF toxin-antitoxin module
MPKEIVLNMGLKDGDKFEVFEKDGMICFMPVAVYPKAYVDKLKNIAAEAKSDYETGEAKGFTDINALISDLQNL